MASQSRPEPMNASPHHSRVKVTLTLSDPVFVAGTHISGKMEVESRADLDSLLGIGVMMVELYAIQEVNSGDHSATSTFIHSRRIFQGPGLPPSNAVYLDYVPGTGELPLPAHHFPARRGQTTFFFRLLIPASSPSSINFGPASIRYEIRASASVAWRGDTCLVTDKREVKVVESWDPSVTAPSPQAVAITEGGKLWAQATLASSVVVGGQPTRIDLHLKNHTQRWTSGVTVTLKRDLYLSTSFLVGKSALNTSDVATQVEFRGPEYSVPPGIEGIARLVIDVPRHSRGVKGGLRVDDNGRTTEGFFEVRCTLRLRIEMPPGSEDTVIILPLGIYHSVAVPEVPESPPQLSSPPCSYPVPVSPGLLSLPPAANLIPVHSENQPQQFDPAWPAPSVPPLSSYFPDQHMEQDIHNWQVAPYSHAASMHRSISARSPSQSTYFTPGLSTSYAPSPRSLPPPPMHVSYTAHIHPGFPIETMDGYTSPDQNQGPIASVSSQNIYSTTHHHSVSPSFLPQSHAQDQLLTSGRAPPPPIQIPSLPNPYDSQDVLHSPRPVPSPKPSFSASAPKSDNVSQLERLADQVGNQIGNLSLDLPQSNAGVGLQGHSLDRQPHARVAKSLPAPPVPSSKDRHFSVQRSRANTPFMSEGDMTNHAGFSSSMDHTSHAPPTPPIAAITPIKFPKAQTELSGLGANLGRDVSPESGLDALERRLLAEVGTRKFDIEERPHVRSVVQPIAIPPSAPPPDTVNDSAISSLTLADREGILKVSPEREQEQDRDSDEHTQHMGGGRHSQSEDDRDARTQKGKGSRKLGKSKHSEEDLDKPHRRRERKKAKDDGGRKLREEAKWRVAAWLGEIDVSAPPAVDDPTSFISPTTPHFVPIAESEAFDPAPAAMADDEINERRRRDVTSDKVSASPNPRSSGFVTISSLSAVVATNDVGGGDGSSFKSLRPSSVNDFRQIPSSSPNRPTTGHRPMSRSPSAEVKPSPPHPSGVLSPSGATHPHLGRLFSGHFPRFPPKPATDPEVKYDIRSARGGRGGKVAQVASLWAAKASTKTGDVIPMPLGVSKKSTVPPPPPPVRKPVSNVLKRGPFPTRSPPGGVGIGNGNGVLPPVPHRTVVASLGLGTREAVPRTSKATTVPAVVSSSYAVPMLSSTASLARVQKMHGVQPGMVPGQARLLPPMISETISDLKSTGAGGGGTGGVVKASVHAGTRPLGELAFGQARLRDLIKKYQG